MISRQKLKLIPVGGLGEVGKNLMLVGYGDDMIMIDCGMGFPEDEMLGVDIVIPDIGYIEDHADKIKAIVLTHGHEDHIGSLPYVLKFLRVPVYGTRFTLGLVKNKLEEYHLTLPKGSREVSPGDELNLGPFDVEFFRVNHSIADTVGLAVDTPVGLMVHMSDFKVDYHAVDGEIIDLQKLGQLGARGVMVLLSDSTNVERPGYTGSEREVAHRMDEIFRSAGGRIIVSTFASQVHRIQTVIKMAHRYNRKVVIDGRSMENTVSVASDLGYLDVPPGTIIETRDMDNYSPHELLIISTGSQGERFAALTRMATGNHRDIEVLEGDTVIVSATPVPGNEKAYYSNVNLLYKLGAHVIAGSSEGVHVSGHASQEEQKLVLSLLRPEFFIPVHGEYRHLVKHAELAQQMGVKPENTLVIENGTVLEFERKEGGVKSRIARKSQLEEILVDGLGVGDVGNIVLRDRRKLSDDGILIVVVAIDQKTGAILSGPDIVTRGFVYVKESERLLDSARDRISDALEDCASRGVTEWSTLKSAVRDAISKYLYEQTRRNPMIMPIILEVNPRAQVSKTAK